MKKIKSQSKKWSRQNKKIDAFAVLDVWLQSGNSIHIIELNAVDARFSKACSKTAILGWGVTVMNQHFFILQPGKFHAVNHECVIMNSHLCKQTVSPQYSSGNYSHIPSFPFPVQPKCCAGWHFSDTNPVSFLKANEQQRGREEAMACHDPPAQTG